MIHSTTDNYYVYAHRKADTNELFYIGKGKRDRAYSKLGRNIIWQRIVNKHGFTVEILKKSLSDLEACKLEIKFISQLSPKANICAGGNGGDVISKLSKYRQLKIKKKKSISMKGKNLGSLNGMYGKKIPNELKKKLSEINSGKNHPQYGKPKSKDTVLKIKMSQKHMAKKVLCIETNQIFDSISETAKYFKINKANLGRLFKGTRKTLKGLHFILIK